MAQTMKWSHDEMMAMPKRLFFRYYGYCLIDQIKRDEEEEKDRLKNKMNEIRNDPNKQWKTL